MRRDSKISVKQAEGMKNIFISLMILFSGVIAAQECKIDLHSLAQPDVNMIQLNKFGQSGLFKIVLSEGFDTITNERHY